MSIHQVKDAIRATQQQNSPATKDDVQTTLGESEDAKQALQSYERAKKHGEIYEYREGGSTVVKITDEATA